MNCDEIASILNAHEAASLSAARRAAVDAHLFTCPECAGAWRVADTLRRERWPDAPQGLLTRIASGFDGADGIDGVDGIDDLDGVDDLDGSRPPAATEAARRAPRWGAAGALLAASVALAVGIAVWPGRDGPAPEINAARDDVLELGRDYRLVANALPPGSRQSARQGSPGRESTSFAGATPARVEVVQFFMYECFPCYAFEPQVDGWETEAEHVEVVRVPLVFGPTAEMHARAFYAAEALGNLDEMHEALFAEIHERGNRLDSEAAMAAFFARFGIDEEAFRQAYRSREVDAKVEAAVELARSLGVTAAPSLVVARRYLTSPSMTGSYEAAFAVVETLAESVYDEAGPSDRCGRSADELAHRQRLRDFRSTSAEPLGGGVTAAGGEAVASSESARSGNPERDGRAAGAETVTSQELVDLVERGCGDFPRIF